MCGIFGLIIPQTTNKAPKTVNRVVRKLFLLSESRGKEASGIAASFNTHTHVLKMPYRSSVLVRSPEYKRLAEKISNCSLQDLPLSIIGHSRLATHGTHEKNKNNQPVIGKRAVIIHNGIIVNADVLWKRFPKLQNHTDVDSEVILALYEMHRGKGVGPHDALSRVFHLIKGEASVAIMETDYPYLILGTNTGSLYYTKQQHSFMFASEQYILSRFVQNNQICRLAPGMIYTLKTTNISAASRTIIKPLPRLVVEQTSTPNNQVHVHTIHNEISKLENHMPNIHAIARIKRCSKCIMPETMPLISFDQEGVCNFCRTYEKATTLGRQALETYIAPYRSRTGDPDCIVALSGGRDSSYGLHYAKTVLKLNPIAYTYDWGMVTDIARRNQSRMCAALGVEHIIVSADIPKKLENIRKNIAAWLTKPDLGMVTLLMAGDKQAEYYAEQLKRKTGVKLVLYCRGNQLEDERFKFGYYGIFDGTPKGVIHNLSLQGKLTMLGYYGKQFLTNPKYINSSLADSALAYASAYLMPHDFLYLWHYIRWNEQKIVFTLKHNYGWETPTDTVATWRIDDGTPAFYNYIYYKIQGFTEHDGLRSNQIREGILSRSRALNLISEENKPRYEALKWYFDRLGLDGDEVLTVVDAMPALY